MTRYIIMAMMFLQLQAPQAWSRSTLHWFIADEGVNESVTCWDRLKPENNNASAVTVKDVRLALLRERVPGRGSRRFAPTLTHVPVTLRDSILGRSHHRREYGGGYPRGRTRYRGIRAFIFRAKPHATPCGDVRDFENDPTTSKLTALLIPTFNHSQDDIMTAPAAFDPNITYQKLPREADAIGLFISPAQYIQGAGALAMIGEYLALNVSGSVGLVITPGRDRALGPVLERSLADAGFKTVKTVFRGESTDHEVQRVAACFRASDAPVRAVIGVGGGKCLDTARMAAFALDVPAVSVPTTASTDAPTAAHSVVYDEHGVFDRVEFSAASPLLVLADLDVLAAAPPRYLVAGMGDAWSTWFEARCCADNPAALTARGGRPTMAALAIARQCHDALLAHGARALEELRAGRAGTAFGRVVEANILLSGLGFESGGLAGAHAVAQGLTVCDDLHRTCLHGELVAIGVMTQLMMERRMDELHETARFFNAVGLPLHLGQLGFETRARRDDLDAIVRHSLDVFFLRYEPFEVTHELLLSSLLEAGQFGRAHA